MAWTTIDNSLVSVGALPFATTVQALRDNPVAIAAGNAGAPRIQTAAIQDSAVTTAKLASGERMNNTNVRNNTASSAVGAVGTYAFMRGDALGGGVTAGTTYSGALLAYSGTGGGLGANPGGTWRAMGTTSQSTEATLFLRVS